MATSPVSLIPQANSGISTIQDLYNLINGTTTTTSGGTTVTNEGLDQAGMNAMLTNALGSSTGLAAVSSGQRAAGGYGSSVNTMLTNDLLTRTAGQIAAANKTTTTTTPDKTVQTGGATVAGTAKSAGFLAALQQLSNTGSSFAQTKKLLGLGTSDNPTTPAVGSAGTNVAAPTATSPMGAPNVGPQQTGVDVNSIVAPADTSTTSPTADVATTTPVGDQTPATPVTSVDPAPAPVDTSSDDTEIPMQEGGGYADGGLVRRGGGSKSGPINPILGAAMRPRGYADGGLVSKKVLGVLGANQFNSVIDPLESLAGIVGVGGNPVDSSGNPIGQSVDNTSTTDSGTPSGSASGTGGASETNSSVNNLPATTTPADTSSDNTGVDGTPDSGNTQTTVVAPDTNVTTQTDTVSSDYGTTDQTTTVDNQGNPTTPVDTTPVDVTTPADISSVADITQTDTGPSNVETTDTSTGSPVGNAISDIMSGNATNSDVGSLSTGLGILGALTGNVGLANIGKAGNIASQDSTGNAALAIGNIATNGELGKIAGIVNAITNPNTASVVDAISAFNPYSAVINSIGSLTGIGTIGQFVAGLTSPGVSVDTSGNSVNGPASDLGYSPAADSNAASNAMVSAAVTPTQVATPAVDSPTVDTTPTVTPVDQTPTPVTDPTATAALAPVTDPTTPTVTDPTTTDSTQATPDYAGQLGTLNAQLDAYYATDAAGLDTTGMEDPSQIQTQIQSLQGEMTAAGLDPTTGDPASAPAASDTTTSDPSGDPTSDPNSGYTADFSGGFTAVSDMGAPNAGPSQDSSSGSDGGGGGGAADGGPISGPGTGVSDSIPTNLSDGEYVLSADVVKALGVPFLDSLQDKFHTPAAVQKLKSYAR